MDNPELVGFRFTNNSNYLNNSAGDILIGVSPAVFYTSWIVYLKDFMVCFSTDVIALALYSMVIHAC